MGGGLAVSGVAAYAFLALSARALGPAAFAPLSVLWAALFVVGPGLFQPVEQELSRSIAHRIAQNDGFATTRRRASALTLGLFLAVSMIIGVAGPFLSRELFGGDWFLVTALVIGVGGYAMSHTIRGYLAATGRFVRYGQWFLADGAAKAVPAAALVLFGVTNTAWFAAALALAAYVGFGVARRGRQDNGPLEREVPGWSELTQSMGHLLLTSMLVAALLNAGTVAVELLATPAEADQAGIFLTGLVIARIPLFFYQAVQAALLPRLADLAADGRLVDLRRSLARFMLALAGLTVLTSIGIYLFGSWAVGLLFGPEYRELSGWDMAVLTLASMLAMGALTLGQALIALHMQARVWWPWLIGLIVFIAVAIAGPDALFERVEAASLLSALATLVLMLVQTVVVLRTHDPDPVDPGDVFEAFELPVEGA
jgi:O-antigen/teichoic acid export membrane protein